MCFLTQAGKSAGTPVFLSALSSRALGRLRRATGAKSTSPRTAAALRAAATTPRSAPMERPTMDTASCRAASSSRAARVASTQCDRPAVSIASGVLPWPGRRGACTTKPRAARDSPSRRTSQGLPVKPWSNSTAPKPPGSAGRRVNGAVFVSSSTTSRT